MLRRDMIRRGAALGGGAALLFGLTAGMPAHSASTPGDGSDPALVAGYGNLPLVFEPNRGQTDERVRFLSRGRGYALFLTDNEAVLSLDGGSEGGRVLRIELIGGAPEPEITGLERLPGVSNYFIGRDRSKWRSGVPHFGKVGYEEIYPGIDLVFYGTGARKLEYDFVVAPGADPGRIALGFEGAEALEIDEAGDLVARLPGGAVRFEKPAIYQEEGDARRPVKGGYVLEDDRVGFELAAYDATEPLVIDPVLEYATYLGGTDDDGAGRKIAVDDKGNVYIPGSTRSLDFPVLDPVQSLCAETDRDGTGGCLDAFVAKLNSDGSGLMYSTYLGGASTEDAYGIAVNSDNEAYVTGRITSAEITNDFPTTKGAYRETALSPDDAFFVKLTAGGGLAYSTYLGGKWDETGWDVTVDSWGRAVIGGSTTSKYFPITESTAIRKECEVLFDVPDKCYEIPFMTVIDPAGKESDHLVYSTFVGDRGSVTGVAIDDADRVYLTGYTYSPEFPVSGDTFQSWPGSEANAFLAIVDPSISGVEGLIYSTYLGGSDGETFGRDVAVKPGCSNCAAYLTGETSAEDFPTTPESFAPFPVLTFDTYITVIDPFTTPNDPSDDLVYSSYFGGSGGWSIAADSDGKAYIGGSVGRALPVTPDAIQEEHASPGHGDAFVAVFDPYAQIGHVNFGLRFSSYLGGSEADNARPVAVTGGGTEGDPFALVLAGSTSSRDFPATKGAFQTEISEPKQRGRPSDSPPPFDVFVARIQGPFDNKEPVARPNFTPMAVADRYEVAEDSVLTKSAVEGLLSNDDDPNDDPLTVDGHAVPSNGTLVVYDDGAFTYTPDAGFIGTDGFTYTVSDGSAEDSAMVTIEVVKDDTINHPPVASDDSYDLDLTDPKSQSLTRANPGVLGNDSDPDDDPLTAELGIPPDHAADFELNRDGGFSYTPNGDFLGIDRFTYVASDGDSYSEAFATVSIKVSDGTLHVSDLDGSSTNLGGEWEAKLAVRIHAGIGLPVDGSNVEIEWRASNGDTGSLGCSNARSVCRVETSIRKKVSEITFEVTDISHGSLDYSAGRNHDPDGDSDGTSITVSKP